MEHADSDVVLWGMTASGRTFRPSDWAERLAGLTSALGADQKLVYSPPVRPVNVRGVKAVIVGRDLAALAPRLYQFFLRFAHDNALQVAYVRDALAAPQALTVPPSAMRPEPDEPV